MGLDAKEMAAYLVRHAVWERDKDLVAEHLDLEPIRAGREELIRELRKLMPTTFKVYRKGAHPEHKSEILVEAWITEREDAAKMVGSVLYPQKTWAWRERMKAAGKPIPQKGC